MKSSTSFLKRYLRKLSGWVPILLLLLLSAVFLFGVITHEVLWEQEEAVDHGIFAFLAQHLVTPSLTRFMEGVTFFASASFLQKAYPAVVLLYLVQKDWKRALEISVIGLGGYVVNYFMKWIFRRPRPDDPLTEPLSNYGFPSGHAMSGFIFYGLLAYLVWKTDWPKGVKILLGALLLLFSLLIGFSRVYLRLHYSSDVAAGFCIGFAWLSLCILVLERLKKKTGAELEEHPS